MKKVACFLVLVVLGTMVFADPFATSIMYNTSYGTLATPIDHASEAGRGFFDLDKTYIFGGLSNLNGTPAISVTDNVLGVNALGGIQLGAYIHNETLPWSLFMNLYHDSTPWTMATKTVTPTVGTKVLPGGSSYDWVTKLVEDKTPGSLASEIDDSIQFLAEYRNMILGGRLSLFYIDRSNPALNYTKKTTDYYDTAIVGVKPNPSIDYTTEERLKTNNHDFFVLLQSPLFIAGDRVDQTAEASISFGAINDFSIEKTETFSSPNSTLGIYTDTLHDDRKQKTNLFGLGGYYKQDLVSPFFRGDTKDFYFEGTAGLLFGIPVDKALEETQAYNYTAGITKTTHQYYYLSTENKVALTLDFDLMGSVGHRFDFNLGKGLALHLDPKLSARIQAGSVNGRLIERKEVEKKDNNNDGVVDEVTTTTTTFSGVSANGLANASNSMVLGLSLRPSCALHYQPEKWRVGLTYGAHVMLDMTYMLTTEKQGKATSVEVNEKGGVTTTTTVESLIGMGSDKSKHDIAWSASLMHALSLNWDISDNARLYADLSLTIGSGIFDLGNLTVQAIISLP